MVILMLLAVLSILQNRKMHKMKLKINNRNLLQKFKSRIRNKIQIRHHQTLILKHNLKPHHTYRPKSL